MKFIWLQHWKLLRSSTYTKSCHSLGKTIYCCCFLYRCKRNTKLCISSIFCWIVSVKNSKKVSFWVQQISILLDQSRILPRSETKKNVKMGKFDWLTFVKKLKFFSCIPPVENCLRIFTYSHCFEKGLYWIEFCLHRI